MGVVRGDNSLFFATGLDNSGLKGGVNDAVGLVQGLASSISKINPFAALAVGAVAAFTTISTQAYNMARNFEQAMKEVETISDATQKDFEGISQAVFDLSKITPDAPEKLAKAYYQIVSAGYDGAKGLKLLETASKSAVAGVTDTITAADGITTVLNAFKLEAEQAELVSDALFKTVQLGKTTFSELSQNLAQAAPLAAATGVDFQQLLAAVATLTKQGVPTAQAMTQIRAAIESTSEVMGDGWTNAYTLQEAFQAVYDQAGGSQNKLKELTGRVEAVSAMLSLTGKNAEGAASDLEALGNAAGSTEKAFRGMNSSNINQLDILRNRIVATTKGIGEAVLEMSNDVAGAINSILDDSAERAIEVIEKERVELFKIKSELFDVNTENEERIKLINELKIAYPDLLSNIDAETISNQDLSIELEKVNQQLISNIILKKQDNVLNEQNTRTSEKLEAVLASERNIRQITSEVAAKYNLELKEGLSFEEQALNVIKQKEEQYGKQLDAANDLVFFLKKHKTLEEEFNKENVVSNKLLEEKRELAERLGISLENNSKKATPEIQKQLDAINQITKEQYQKNKQVLDEFINSENKVIAEAAKKRKEVFEFRPKGPEDDSTFSDYLKKREEEYNAYALAIANKDEELSEKLRQQYDIQEADYVAFLRKLYSETEDVGSKVQILDVLKSKGTTLTREVVKSVSEVVANNEIVWDMKLNPDSIVNIKTRLEKLQEDFEKASPDERALLAEKIIVEKQKLEAAESHIKQEKDLYEDLHRSLSDLNVKELRDYIAHLNQKLNAAKGNADLTIQIQNRIANATLKINEKLIDQSSQLLNEASRLFRSFGDDGFADLIDDFSEASRSLTNVLNVLGNDGSTGLEKATSVVGLFVTGYSKLKELIDGLNKDKGLDRQISLNQKVLEQVRIEKQINSIYQQRNELIRSSSVLLDSFYKEDYKAATEKQIEAFASFEKIIDTLKSGALIQGTGKTSGFFGIGAKDKNFNFSLNDVLNYLDGSGKFPFSYNDGTKLDAFLDAVGAVDDILKSMQKTVSDVAQFSEDEWLDFLSVVEASGRLTDESTKLLFDEAKKSLQEYMDALEEMRDIITDVAGSLGNDLEEALVTAFNTGEDAALNFKESISSILRDLFLEQLKNNQFKKYFDQLQKEMEDSFSPGGDSDWVDDIKRFSESISPQMQQALDAMEAFNEQLELEGYKGFGSEDSGSSQNGLSGAIRRELTEETASELTGLFRNQYEITKAHFETSLKQLDNSNNIVLISQSIADNTFETVEQLKTVVTELTKIAFNTEQIYLDVID